MDALELSPGMIGGRNDPCPAARGGSRGRWRHNRPSRELAVAEHPVAREQVQRSIEADLGVNRLRPMAVPPRLEQVGLGRMLHRIVVTEGMPVSDREHPV